MAGSAAVNGLLTAGVWLHVAAASWWILTSITVEIAGAAVSAESVEGREFLARVAPKIIRANAAAAVLLLATGVVNLYGAGMRRRFAFPAPFSGILAAKAALYVLRAAGLRASSRAQREAAGGAAKPAAGKLVAWSVLTAAAGAGAMMLGVWLAGE